MLHDTKAFLLVQRACDVSPRRPSRRVNEPTMREINGHHRPPNGIPSRRVFSTDGCNFTRGARVRRRGDHFPDAALFLDDVVVDLNG